MNELLLLLVESVFSVTHAPKVSAIPGDQMPSARSRTLGVLLCATGRAGLESAEIGLFRADASIVGLMLLS